MKDEDRGGLHPSVFDASAANAVFILHPSSLILYPSSFIPPLSSALHLPSFVKSVLTDRCHACITVSSETRSFVVVDVARSKAREVQRARRNR